MAAKGELAKLRTEISKLSGRLPVSENVEYLTRKLSELRQKKADGEEVKRHHAEPSTVLSVSMPVPARAATIRMADKLKGGTSALVRLALGEWAERNGHKNEVEHFILSAEEG